MKTVTVIGSGGFIAGYVTEELHNRGLQVVGLQRHLNVHVPEAERLALADKVIVGDIKDAEAVEKAVSLGDYVINLAGILGTSETNANPIPAIGVNILGTENVLRACEVWNREFLQIAVGNYWMKNAYAITRTAAEKLTIMYADQKRPDGNPRVRANVVRALNAYGPRQSFASYKKIVPSFVLNALANKPLRINGDGEQLMDMVYVRDLAKCLVDVLINPQQSHEKMYNLVYDDIDAPLYSKAFEEIGQEIYGNVYQCGSQTSPTVNEIAEVVLELTGSKSPVEHIDMRMGEPKGAKIVADYRTPWYSVDLRQGLISTIEYYQLHFNEYNI